MLKMYCVVLCTVMLNLILCINSLVLEQTGIDYNSCLLHLIQQFFKEDDTLCFVTSENYKFPFGELTNPYIVIDSDKPILLKMEYTRNFVILTESAFSLRNELYLLQNSNLWSPSNSRRAKFLVITYTSGWSEIFNVFWKKMIMDIIVLVPSYDNRHLVYMSNPWSNGFYCKKSSTLIRRSQHCLEELNKLVKMPITNFGGCLLDFNINSITWKMEKKALDFLMNALKIYLNFTIHYGNSNKYPLQVTLNDNYDHHDTTKVVFRTDWTWVTAAPVRIFRFETISSLFQVEVWTLTGHAITSTKELIESNMSLFVSDLIYHKVLRNTKSSAMAFSKLTNKLRISKNYSHTFDLIYNYRNAALLMPTVDFIEINEKRKFNMFIDNYVLGNVQLVFRLPEGFPIVDSINQIITVLTESGIYKRHFEGVNQVSGENTNVEQFIPLSLQHLYFVFVLLIVGLLLSLFIFILEQIHYVYHKRKISAKKQQKMVC
ncbi:hypothetical protein FQA39_LY00970 [Lamprigera yunnana]|nr:hypothetical protein FQA39_LY00970 [Lamprigera yunnana]